MMNKDNRNDKIRKIAKKGLTFSLCAVLAGGLDGAEPQQWKLLQIRTRQP